MRPTNRQRDLARNAGLLVALAIASTILGVIAYTAYELYDALAALGEALG